MLKRYKKAIEEVSIEHPLQETYEAVLRGEKSWKEYEKEVHEHIFGKNDWDARDVALYHILKTLDQKRLAGKDRDFWAMANKVTSYYDLGDAFTKWLLTEIHKKAAVYGKHHTDVLEHPEYWQTLTGTVFLEHMHPKEFEETLQRIDDAVTHIYPNPEKRALLKHPLNLARTLAVLAEEILKKEKGLTKSQRNALAELSARATIRVMTIAKLMARGK